MDNEDDSYRPYQLQKFHMIQSKGEPQLGYLEFLLLVDEHRG